MHPEPARTRGHGGSVSLRRARPRPKSFAEFPDLEIEDIRRALAFAAAAVDERQLPLLTWT